MPAGRHRAASKVGLLLMSIVMISSGARRACPTEESDNFPSERPGMGGD